MHVLFSKIIVFDDGRLGYAAEFLGNAFIVFLGAFSLGHS
jgi:hypothetical protein